MATNDIRIKDLGGNTTITTERWQTEAAATAIAVGEPVKIKVAGSKYVIPVADAEPLIGTTTRVVGITKSAGTHTASADGYVDVFVVDPRMVFEVKAKSATAADTQAEIDALRGKRVLLDLTTGTYTVDTATVDANANGVTIVGGDAERQVIYFQFRPAAIEGAIA